MELENLKDLVDLAVSAEERLLLGQFSEDAADCPDVNSQTVLLLAQQNFGGTVPEGFDFVSEGLDGKGEGAGESKVCDFESASSVDEEILGLEISVDDPPGVAVVDAIAELVEEELDLVLAHGVFVLTEVFLEVVLDELKD